MKHLFTTFLLCLIAGYSFAQSSSGTAPVLSVDSTNTLQTALASAAPSAEVTPEVFRKNSVKMNLSSLAFSNYSFSYERAIARKITLVGGYSFMPETRISSIPVVDKALEFASESEEFEDGDDFEEAFKKGNAGSSAITGEIRFYTGKKPGARGFYASLYGRYTTMDLSYLDVYEDALGIEHDLPYNATLKGFSGGLMLGAQWLIAKRVTFDWYIIGGHFGSISGDLNAKVDLSMLSEQDKAELEAEVEDIFEYSDGKSYVDATVRNDGLFGKVKGPFGGIRAVGFNIGIAF